MKSRRPVWNRRGRRQWLPLLGLLPLLSVLLLSLLAQSPLGMVAATAADQASERTCPVCYKIMHAVSEHAADFGEKRSTAFETYCGLPTLSGEDQRFCYNIDNVKRDLHRLLDLGADARRICGKVRAINPHFCELGSAPVEPQPQGSAQGQDQVQSQSQSQTRPADDPRRGTHLNEHYQRGIIYE